MESETDTLASDSQGATEPGSDPDVTARRGAVFGRYVLLGKLGQGGMGVVFAAYDPELDRKVAIKLLHQRAFEGTTDKDRSRLIGEAKALGRLSHPNIVAVFDVGTQNDDVWLAMEFVSGRTLGAWRKQQRPGWREVADVMRQAGRGLAGAHEAGLVHRDFKPENVMLGDDGRVRVMDFGLALPSGTPRDLEEEGLGSKQTLSQSMVTRGIAGTPRYMAPEQFRGDSVTHLADQFAFCITMWEALYGARPFAGDTLAELAANVCEGVRAPVPREPSVPSWLRDVVNRGLAVEESERWPSMEALLEALEGSRARRYSRRAAAAVVSCVALGASVWGLAKVQERAEVRRCERQAAEIDALWNDDVKSRVQASAGEATAFARHTAQTIVPELDGFAARWSEAAADSCVAARVENELSEASLGRRLGCLERSRTQFGALVDDLSEGSALELAVQAAVTLEAPERCLEDDRLALLPEPPAGNEEEVEEIRLGMAALEVQLSLGKSPAVEGDVDALLTRARALGWEPLEAEVGALAADTAFRLSDNELALERFKSAYFLATQFGMDGLAFETAVRVSTTLTDLTRFDEAQDWHRHAAAVLAKSDDPPPASRAAEQSALGVLQAARGNYPEAIEALQRSLELVREALPPGHPQVASSRLELASALGRSGDREAERALVSESVEALEAQLGPDHPEVGRSLGRLAVCQTQLGHHREAKASMVRGLEILEAAYGSEHLTVAKMLVNYGSILRSLGDHEEAQSNYERAIPILEDSLGEDHPALATVQNNLGWEYLDGGDTQGAADAFSKAVAIKEKRLGPDHLSVASSLTGLSKVARVRGDFESARRHAKRSLAIHEKASGPDHPDVVFALHSLAKIEREAGEAEQALAYIEKGKAVLANNSEDVVLEASFDKTHAMVLYDLGRTDEALTISKQAVASLDDAGNPDPQERLDLLDVIDVVEGRKPPITLE